MAEVGTSLGRRSYGSTLAIAVPALGLPLALAVELFALRQMDDVIVVLRLPDGSGRGAGCTPLVVVDLLRVFPLAELPGVSPLVAPDTDRVAQAVRREVS